MLYELLPELYRDEDMKRYTEIMNKVFDDLEIDIGRLWDLIDPDRCPIEFLPYFAKTLGWKLVGNVPDSWRLQVRYAQQILKAGGRAEAIIFLLRSLGFKVEAILQVWRKPTTGEVLFVPIDRVEQRPAISPDCEWCPTTDILIGVSPVANWSESYWEILDKIFEEAKIPIHVKPGTVLTVLASMHLGVGVVGELWQESELKNEFKTDVLISSGFGVGVVGESWQEVVINA